MYQQVPPPQHFQAQPAYTTQMVRMAYDTSGQQVQYLAPTPPSSTPSPGQPHQAYHPQPSPAVSSATFATAPQQQVPVMYPLITTGAPQLMPQFYQGVQGHPGQPIQVLMPPHQPAPSQ